MGGSRDDRGKPITREFTKPTERYHQITYRKEGEIPGNDKHGGELPERLHAQAKTRSKSMATAKTQDIPQHIRMAKSTNNVMEFYRAFYINIRRNKINR